MQVEVNPEWSQRLKALADRIAAVEVRIKQAEQISGRVVYPAVGELRYLGRNLARISDNADGHAVITLGEGHRITLIGVAGDDLTAANFAFV